LVYSTVIVFYTLPSHVVMIVDANPRRGEPYKFTRADAHFRVHILDTLF
jgi:hypothetical protein